jgi:hypothetical protein
MADPFVVVVEGVGGGVKTEDAAADEVEDEDETISFVRGRSLVYMRSKSSLIWVCVAFEKAT